MSWYWCGLGKRRKAKQSKDKTRQDKRQYDMTKEWKPLTFDSAHWERNEAAPGRSFSPEKMYFVQFKIRKYNFCVCFFCGPNLPKLLHPNQKGSC